MNIKENKTINLTDDEYNSLDAGAKARLKHLLAKEYSVENGVWTFKFYGISDKQTAAELCGYFGVKVTQ